MAFDLATFKTRAGSAIIFAAVMLGGLLGGNLAFFCLMLLVCFLCAREYIELVYEKVSQSRSDDQVSMVYALAVLIVYVLIANSKGIVFIENTYQSAWLWFGGVLVTTLAWMALSGKSYFNRLLVGYIYIGISLGLLSLLYLMNKNYVLGLISLIWVNDTMQYIVGSFLGKHKMAPIISPKKTWEGTIGGSGLAILCSLALVPIASMSWIEALMIGLCASVAGTLGDLLESKLKREAGVKDSGNILPGHGGALDRFDSILLAGPVCYILIRLWSLAA
jgi:phosphatidate cytidylyltransferase